MSRKQNGTHSYHIDNLVQRLVKKYDLILRNIEYRYCNQVVGEIDIVGINYKHFDFYEVKCNDNFDKAYEQLKRAQEYWAKSGIDIRLYYYCGHSDTITKIG